jgi:hypothetical protein
MFKILAGLFAGLSWVSLLTLIWLTVLNIVAPNAIVAVGIILFLICAVWGSAWVLTLTKETHS